MTCGCEVLGNVVKEEWYLVHQGEVLYLPVSLKARQISIHLVCLPSANRNSEFLAFTGEKLNGAELVACDFATHYSLNAVLYSIRGEFLAFTGEKLNGAELVACDFATHYSLNAVLYSIRGGSNGSKEPDIQEKEQKESQKPSTEWKGQSQSTKEIEGWDLLENPLTQQAHFVFISTKKHKLQVQERKTSAINRSFCLKYTTSHFMDDKPVLDGLMDTTSLLNTS
ncbi:hypothetical protein Tco_0845246 [Tanacetum coccineum]